MEINKDLFEPFENLIEIEILGEKYRVPENNTLLRCFQYLSMETISFGDFCWNGDCLNCQVWIKNGDKEKPLMTCRAKVEKGMKIVRLAEEIKLEQEVFNFKFIIFAFPIYNFSSDVKVILKILICTDFNNCRQLNKKLNSKTPALYP